MFDRFFAGLPFLFPTLGRNNANTLPVANINVTADNVVLELPPHAFYGRDYVGGFFIDLRTAIPTGTTATLPVLLGTNGDTRPLVTTEARRLPWATSPEQACISSTTTGIPTRCSL